MTCPSRRAAEPPSRRARSDQQLLSSEKERRAASFLFGQVQGLVEVITGQFEDGKLKLQQAVGALERLGS